MSAPLELAQEQRTARNASGGAAVAHVVIIRSGADARGAEPKSKAFALVQLKQSGAGTHQSAGGRLQAETLGERATEARREGADTRSCAAA